MPHKCTFITNTASVLGIHLADVQGAAISSHWDFPPKVLVIFFGFWERRVLEEEACSSDSVEGVNNPL